jgi:hypothetical protein
MSLICQLIDFVKEIVDRNQSQGKAVEIPK